MQPSIIGLAIIALSLASTPARAQTCDWNITPNGTGNSSLATANTSAQAGDVVCLDGGEYAGQQIKPGNSGTEVSPITFMKDPNATEDVLFRDVSFCVYLLFADWIVIDGFTCNGRAGVACEGVKPTSDDVFDVDVGVQLNDASHNVVRNMTIRHVADRGIRAQGCQSANCPNPSDPDGSDSNQIVGNDIDCVGYDQGTAENGKAIEIVYQSDENLVENNSIGWSGHMGIQVTASRRNLVRNNTIRNPWHRGISVAAPNVNSSFAGFAHGWNVVDSNLVTEFGTVRPPADPVLPWGDLGISLPTYQTIVRRNLVRDGSPNAVNLSPGGSNPSWPNLSGNRIYQNTFVANTQVGIRVDDQNSALVDLSNNELVNNVFLGNGLDPVADPDNTPETTQIRIDVRATNPWDHLLFENNEIRSAVGVADPVVYVDDPAVSGGFLVEQTLADLEAMSEGWFNGNVEHQHPLFVNESAADYRLVESSPLVDAGRFLTTVATGGCSGTTIPVVDGSFFFAGLDKAPALADGDSIELENGGGALQVTEVDLITSPHELTVDQSVTCSAGDGVALAYEGAAPDIGYFEGGVTEEVFLSIAAEDGFVRESVGQPGTGGYKSSTQAGSLGLQVGDTTKDGGVRSFLSFDTSSLPSNAVIKGAFLVLRTGQTIGDPESLATGGLIVEMADGVFGASADLERQDWEWGAAASMVVGTLQSTVENDLWFIAVENDLWFIDLGQMVGGLDEIDPDGRTQIRLRLDPDTDGGADTDLLGFFPGDEPTKEPILRLTYESP